MGDPLPRFHFYVTVLRVNHDLGDKPSLVIGAFQHQSRNRSGNNDMSSNSDNGKNTASDKQPDLQAILNSTKSNKSKSRRNLMVGALILAALGAGAYYLGLGSGSNKLDYATQKVTIGDLSMVVTSTGSVQPTVQVDISSELSGTIRKVNATFNSTVKSGEVIAELDTNRLEADLKSAQAKLASAKASVLKAEAETGSARSTLERRKSLFNSKVSSQQDLDSAQFAYDSAIAALEMNKASVLSAEADLRLAEVDLGKAKIVSPIDGVILTRDVDPGATVASSLNAPVLFTIAGDLKQMELQVAVDEADVGKVKEGQSASFNVDAYPERRFPAKIENVRFASETVSNVVTYKAILTVDNSDLLLRPGMTATANITVDGVEGALLIPNAALRFQPAGTEATSGRQGNALTGIMRPPRMGGPRGGNRQEGEGNRRGGANIRQVYILKDGAPQAISVDVGVSDGRLTAVKSEQLKEGDLVITDATERKQ